jgi:hypothetical protein
MKCNHKIIVSDKWSNQDVQVDLYRYCFKEANHPAYHEANLGNVTVRWRDEDEPVDLTKLAETIVQSWIKDIET